MINKLLNKKLVNIRIGKNKLSSVNVNTNRYGRIINLSSTLSRLVRCNNIGGLTINRTFSIYHFSRLNIDNEVYYWYD